MAPSTDNGICRKARRLTWAAFALAGFYGLALSNLTTGGPTATNVVLAGILAVLMAGVANAALDAHLACRRARVARANPPEQPAPAPTPEPSAFRHVPSTTEFGTLTSDEAVTEVVGRYIGPRQVLDTEGRSVRVVYAPLAELAVDLVMAANELHIDGFDRADRILLASRIKAVEALVVELHRDIDDYLFSSVRGTEAADVNRTLQSLLRALGVDNAKLKAPRNRFFDKPDAVQNKT